MPKPISRRGRHKVKVGTEDKGKTKVALVLFGLALLAVVYELWPSSTAPQVGMPSAATQSGPHATPVFSKLDPSLRLDLLKGSEDIEYGGSGRDIFHAQAAPPPVDVGKVDVNPITNTPVAQQVAAKPTIPLKFYGFASDANKKQIFLYQGEDVYVVREGDIVKGRYKIVHVNPNNVEIEDVLGNYSQTVPLILPNS
jgi:hypothetical protein